MASKISIRNISQIYLTLVPFLSAALAFAIGHVSYKIYLPIWLVNVCLMGIAAWLLGAFQISNIDVEKKEFAVMASWLIAPWMLIAVFAGMGPPPENVAGWVETITEQQIRYSMLIIVGVLMAGGLTLLRENLKKAGENYYSLLGFTAITIAIPLFILNMAFWGNYLAESFKIFVVAASETRPDWYVPVRALFALISETEVALIYLATAAFAASLKSTGWFTPNACRVYIFFSFLGFVASLFPSSLPEPFLIVSYLVSIPAFPFIMPYLMAVNLLRRAGNELITSEQVPLQM